MHLLYVDESGSVADPSQQYFVLAGLTVFEREGWWISKRLDSIAARFRPDDSATLELHGSPMLKGKGVWRAFPLAQRIQAMKDALGCIQPTVRRFSVALHGVIHSGRSLFATRATVRLG